MGNGTGHAPGWGGLDALRVASSTVEDVYVLGIDTVDAGRRRSGAFHRLIEALAETEAVRCVAMDDVACPVTDDGVLFAVKGVANRHVPLCLALTLHDREAGVCGHGLRFGISAGPAKWITLGDGSRQVIGHTVTWTARVTSAAEGGQVLASGRYHDIYLRGGCQDELPGYRFTPVYDLRTARGEPIPAYEVAAA